MPEPVGRPEVPARAGRAAGASRSPSSSPTTWARVGAGRAARRRGVLHAERLPDHRHPAQPVAPARPPRAPGLLDPPGAPPAARAVRRPGGRLRLGHDRLPEPGPGVRGGVVAAALYVEQLVVHRPERLLLRPVRAAIAGQPPVVAGRGGAVLPAVAVGRADRGGACCRHRWRAAAPAHLRPRGGARRHPRAPPAASFVALALLYHPGLDPTRVYEGTDTRACGLLIGAALAIVLPTRPGARGGGDGGGRVTAGGSRRTGRGGRSTWPGWPAWPGSRC